MRAVFGQALFLTSQLAAGQAASLDSLCTSANVLASLPTSEFAKIQGLVFETVTANVASSQAVSSIGVAARSTSSSYCNVTINYAHNGKNDSINVWYYFPSPAQFKNRFLATGGGGLAINSGGQGLAAGLTYGAVTGLTDGGFGSFSNDLTTVLLKGNGSLNYDAITNFGYLSIHEMTELGKYLAQSFYASSSNASSTNSTSSSKLYSYYQGCSEGGREGWSQVQRYPSQFDGAVIGAPAIRQAYQQPLHLLPQILEYMHGYVPSSCELERIYNDTLSACDGLDGRVDGIIGRSDLCKVNYNISSSIGNSYSCSSQSSGSVGTGMGGGMGGPPSGNPTTSNSTSEQASSAATNTIQSSSSSISSSPVSSSSSSINIGQGSSSNSSSSTTAVNGTVTAEAVAIFNAMIFGPYDSHDRHLYIGFQPGADIPSLAAGTYNSTSGIYENAGASGIGMQWVNYFLSETNTTTLDLSNTTVNDLRAWMVAGMQKYYSTLETVWTDLSSFKSAGGKVLHYHGEADPSIPADSSVLYWEQVRRTMFANSLASSSNNSTSYNATLSSMSSFYQLYLVPGGVHCGAGSGENATWPTDTLGTVIDWVENGNQPTKLNATVVGSGTRKGQREDLCAFPSRPSYSAVAGNGTGVACVSMDMESTESWLPALNSIPLNVWGWGL